MALKTFADGIALLAEQDLIIKEASAEKARIGKAMVEAEFCPLRVGQIVEVTGYSHRGKRMMVSAISVEKKWFAEIGYRAIGQVLKADGTPSKNMAEHFVNMVAPDTAEGAA